MLTVSEMHPCFISDLRDARGSGGRLEENRLSSPQIPACHNLLMLTLPAWSKLSA